MVEEGSVVNFALTMSKSELVAVVGDTRFRSLPRGMHFHHSGTRVTVGGVDVTVTANVSLLSDGPTAPVLVRRLEVGWVQC